MNLKILASAFLISTAISTAWARTASADTSLELLHGWNYNEDFNGDKERTILTIKTFQPWSYGTFFMYYDITGPWTTPDASAMPNEKGGFFGGTSVTFSVKRIGEALAGTKWDWGALADFSLRYELEHVSKFGALNYYGLQYDFRFPYFDFVSATSVIRDDWSLSGVDLQLGGAWQMTFPIGDITDVVFAGFFSWGVFGEGEGAFTVGPDAVTGGYASIPTRGGPYFITQPQLMVDVLKLARVAERKIYVGVEYQLSTNRYLIPGVEENVAQLLFKWNI